MQFKVQKILSGILKSFPLGVKSLWIQIFYGLILFALVIFFQFNWLAFLSGWIFANIYMLIFIYSVFLIFQQKRLKLGSALLGLKWFLLLGTFILASWLWDGKSFLIGLSAILPFLICYILENRQKREYCS